MGNCKSDRAFSLLSILLLVACGGLGHRNDAGGEAGPADGPNGGEAAAEAPLLDSVPGDVLEAGQADHAGIVEGGAVETAPDAPLVLDLPPGVDTPQATNDGGAPDQIPGDGSGGTGGSGGAGDAAGDGAFVGSGGSVATGGTVGSGGVHGTGGFATSTGGNSGGSGGIVVSGSGGSGAIDANLDCETVDLAVEDGGSMDDMLADGEVFDAADESLADADAPTTDGTDACSARSADDTAGIFVSPSGIAGASCGTRQAPCASVQVGIANAKNSARAWVYLAPGLYVESISLVAGVSLDGGWSVQGDAWTPDCGAQASAATVIQAPADKNITVLVDALGGASSMSRVTVLSKAQTAVLPGESLYGIFARGASTSLAIDSVVVTVASAVAGASGAQGSAGAAASTAGCSSSADGGPGGTGATGVGSNYGFTSAGYIKSNGYPGVSGGTGNNGTPGSGSGQCSVCWAPAADCSTLCPPTSTTQCNYNSGLPGCGGLGGGGGSPGLGGGSSIALFTWDAQVTVTNSTLTAGNGGNGGDGGPGGPGGQGAAGAMGASMLCAHCYIVSPPIPPSVPRVCGTASPATQLASGPPGGAGGLGGPGGQGGPGGGGWSCGYYRGGSGLVDLAASSISHGDPGQGGSPSGNPGFAMDACGEPGSPAGVGTRTCAALEIATFPISFNPFAIATGPDGNIWILSSYFSSSSPSIAKVSPTGLVTTFALPSPPFGITAGPDGNLWFTEPAGKIGRMSPTGELTEFSGMGVNVRGIAAGPDGNLWFTRTMFTPPFGKITTAGTVTMFNGPQTFAYKIAPGPESEMWYTVNNTRNFIGKIDASGAQTEYRISTVTSFPWGIVSGPDMNIWFVEQGSMPNTGLSVAPSTIGRSTPDGVVVKFPLPDGHYASDIAVGMDGNLWFTENIGVGRITTTGAITEFPVSGGSIEITSGPEGRLWFTQTNGVASICP